MIIGWLSFEKKIRCLPNDSWRGRYVNNIDCSVECFPPIVKWHLSLSQESEPSFNNMLMFPLNSYILGGCVIRASNLDFNPMFFSILKKWFVLTSIITPYCLDEGSILIFHLNFELFKHLKSLTLSFKWINLSVSCMITQERNIIIVAIF